MTRLSATDALFHYADSEKAPMNMGSVQILSLPEDYKGDFFENFKRFIAARIDTIPKLKMRIVQDMMGLPNWVPVDDIDIDYHVRRTRVKSEDEAELYKKIGRIQHRPFDPDKPLFLFYVIEGLKDGRIAVVQKFHHAMADGKTAVRMMGLFSDQGEKPARKKKSGDREEDTPGMLRRMVTGGLEDIRRTAVSLSGMFGAVGKLAGADGRKMLKRLQKTPSTIFNKPLSHRRVFAFQNWPMQRLTKVRRAAGLTFNEIGLVLLSGALRRYLDEIDALPEESIVCNVPVAVQSEGSSSGNAVLAMWIPIGTHIEDRAERIKFIKAGFDSNKELISEVLESTSAGQGVQLPSFVMRSMGMAMGIGWLAERMQSPGNLAMSSVPSPKEPITVAGANVDSLYGLPMILHGQAVSTTFSSYADKVVLSILCCEKALPDPDRIMDFMREELDALSELAPKSKPRRKTARASAA